MGKVIGKERSGINPRARKNVGEEIGGQWRAECGGQGLGHVHVSIFGIFKAAYLFYKVEVSLILTLMRNIAEH